MAETPPSPARSRPSGGWDRTTLGSAECVHTGVSSRLRIAGDDPSRLPPSSRHVSGRPAAGCRPPFGSGPGSTLIFTPPWMTPTDTVTRSRMRPAPSPIAASMAARPHRSRGAHPRSAAAPGPRAHRGRAAGRSRRGSRSLIGAYRRHARPASRISMTRRSVPFSPNRIVPGVDGSPLSTQSPRNSSGNVSTSHFEPQVPPVSSSETQVSVSRPASLSRRSVQIDVGPHRRRGAALHVDHAAAVHLAVRDRAAPGIARPVARRDRPGTRRCGR